jgi:hypothetical protein
MRLYSVQLRILPRLIWGIGALVLAHYELNPSSRIRPSDAPI